MTFRPTESQREAIEVITGDLFISAGAGSGKTAVLARRFARAVEQGAAADEVLAITFTQKAAAEVAERVRRVLRYEAGRPAEALALQHAWISTIHGLCSRILRRHAIEAGIAPGFRVLDPAESGLMREQAFDAAVDTMWAEDRVPGLLGAFGAEKARETVLRLHDRLRSLGAGPEDLAEVERHPFAEALVDALVAVEAALEAHPPQPANATQASNIEALGTVFAMLKDISGCPEEAQVGPALDAATACRLVKRCPKTKEAVSAADDALKALIGAVRDQEVARHAETLRALLSTFDQTYRGLKRTAGALDQDDLQEAVVEFFRRRPPLARSYARRFRMMMVDEFQDTNELQLGVIEPLRRDDLCVVGDERQAIYSFRDADVEVFRRVRAGIARRVSLDTNFRSHPDVLAFVNALFGADDLFGEEYVPLLAPEPSDTERGDEPAGEARSMEPASPAPRAEVLLVEREGWEGRRWREAEAESLAARLAEIVRSGQAKAGDIVVLLRAFTNSAPYLAALEATGLPAAIGGGGAFCDQPEIVELEALLAVAALPSDTESLAKLLLGELADLSSDTLLALHAHARECGEGTWAALCSATEGGLPLDAAQVERLQALRGAVDVLRRDALRRGLGEALRTAVRVLDVEATLVAGGASGDRAWANVRKLIRMADAFDAEENGDAGAFVERLRALRRLGKLGQASAVAGDAVRLMTVHAAKGLEFPVVAVADLGHKLREPADTVFIAPAADGRLDWSLRLPDSHLGEPGHKPRSWQRMQQEERARQHAEEKRLLYVACTRAEQVLILSGVAKLDEAEDGTEAGWVRGALGLTPEAGESGVRVTGESTWMLRLVRPEDGRDRREEAPPLKTTGQPATGLVAPTGVDTPPPALAGCAGAAPAPMAASAGPPSALSFTALKTLELCPYRFYAERILRLARSAPGETSAMDFGNALHAAMQAARHDGERLTLSEERLAAIASGHRLSPTDLPRLAQAVGAFANSSIAARAYTGERVAREVPFVIPLGETRLAGAIDLLSWRGEDALVVDYKTGASAPEAESLADAYRLQAECYALGLLESGAERVDVVFVAVEQSAETSGHTFVAKDASGLRRKIEALAARACGGPYERREQYDPKVCDDCAARGAFCGLSGSGGRPRDAA